MKPMTDITAGYGRDTMGGPEPPVTKGAPAKTRLQRHAPNAAVTLAGQPRAKLAGVCQGFCQSLTCNEDSFRRGRASVRGRREAAT
jgi:hypothetical protein